MHGYANLIQDATGETDPAMLAQIEDVMRHNIFHSTLDWQSKEEFAEGARAALEVIRLMNSPRFEAIMRG